MAARAEALWIAATTDDVAPRSHGSRYEAQLAVPGAYRSVSGDPELTSKVLFALYVVVVAVHSGRGDVEVGKLLAPAECSEHLIEQQAAVRAGEFLGPAEGTHIVVEQP